ncbi:MAG: GDSL-type esterase/lipase family protein, partial [Cryobacterium sp.]
MQEIIRWALVPVMRAWAASAGAGLGHVPRPMDAPHAHSRGIDSDRILVFGSGPAVGWGVLSHDLALPGSIARALSARSGRGADVDVVFNPMTTVQSAAAELSGLRLWRYDAIVVTLGGNDALTLTSPRTWRRELGALLRLLEETSSRSTRIFMLGVQNIRSVPAFDSPLGSIAAAHAAILNRATAELCTSLPGATFVRLTDAGSSSPERFRTAADYRHWAGLIADAMVCPLAAERAEAGTGTDAETDAETERGADPAGVPEPEHVREEWRQRAVNALGILDTEPTLRVDRIVALAKRSFGTRSAAFSVADGDRQRHTAAQGDPPMEAARDGSFSDLALRGQGALVIGDARDDVRFRDFPHVVGAPYVRFYAGFPIESADGERIGAL